MARVAEARVAEENVAEGSEMTPVSELRQEMAWAAATDAANQNMRAHGRTVWDADDYNVATAELDRLLEGERESEQCFEE